MTIDPRHGLCLLTAVNAGSIRSAADLLDMEPSSVSRNIAALERTLSVTLIERGRRGVRPTDAGAVLIAFLRREQGEYEALQSEFDALRGLQRGSLTIAIGEGFVGDFIGNALKSFAQDFPGIDYHLNTGSTEQVMDLVGTDQAHLGLAYNVEKDPHLRLLAEAAQPIALISGTEFSDRHNLPETLAPSDIANLPCALLTRAFGVGSVVEKASRRNKLLLSASVRTDSIAVLKSFVREGLGVTFLPRFVVVREIMEGSMVAHNLSMPDFGLGYAHLIARRGRRLPEAAVKLSAIIKRESAALHVTQR